MVIYRDRIKVDWMLNSLQVISRRPSVNAIVSFIPSLCFVSISTFSLLTGSISHYWNACFLLCSIALGGWMILYSAQLRLGGGVVIYRSNLLLVWFLIFAVLISALARFASPQRYVAVLVLGLSRAAFHTAGSKHLILNPAKH